MKENENKENLNNNINSANARPKRASIKKKMEDFVYEDQADCQIQQQSKKQKTITTKPSSVDSEIERTDLESTDNSAISTPIREMFESDEIFTTNTYYRSTPAVPFTPAVTTRSFIEDDFELIEGLTSPDVLTTQARVINILETPTANALDVLINALETPVRDTSVLDTPTANALDVLINALETPVMPNLPLITELQTPARFYNLEDASTGPLEYDINTAQPFYNRMIMERFNDFYNHFDETADAALQALEILEDHINNNLDSRSAIVPIIGSLLLWLVTEL